MKELFNKITNLFEIIKKTLQDRREHKKIKTPDTTIVEKKTTKEVIIENIKVIVFAFLCAMTIRSFLYEPFHIPSGSMKPGLVEGDYIVASKFSYGYSKYSAPIPLPIAERLFDFKKPKRGDIVIFRLPKDPKIHYIKRLIGLPNDKIQIKNSFLYINDKKINKIPAGKYFDKIENIELNLFLEELTEKKQYNTLNYKFFIENANNTREYYIPEGYYFFLGDNRDNSLDSRFPETGFVPYQNIVGEAKIIFFSKEEGLLKFWKWRFTRFLNIIK